MTLWKKTKRLKRWAAFAAALLLALVACLMGVDWFVSASTARQIYLSDDVPQKPVAIVFGARVRRSGVLSPVLADRVLTAVELYKAGKVHKLLMTGDNSRKDYDEPTAMKNFAVKQGVPPEDIALDYAGFRTYDSCYRAKAIFGVTSAILVTQKFHLPRAVYTARHLGINAVGVPADRHDYSFQKRLSFREKWATALAWVQVHVTKPKPHFLGPKVAIL
jgi:vancomycin permeability regulator SanA